MGEWIEWSGGECPVTDRTVVEIETRNGMLWSPDIATRHYWHHGGNASDIIRYRICDLQPAEPDTPAKTLRDEFAMAALTGLLAHASGEDPHRCPAMAYVLADAMLTERKESK